MPIYKKSSNYQQGEIKEKERKQIEKENSTCFFVHGSYLLSVLSRNQNLIFQENPKPNLKTNIKNYYIKDLKVNYLFFSSGFGWKKNRKKIYLISRFNQIIVSPNCTKYIMHIIILFFNREQFCFGFASLYVLEELGTKLFMTINIQQSFFFFRIKPLITHKTHICKKTRPIKINPKPPSQKKKMI
jgi:hypothetical protein